MDDFGTGYSSLAYLRRFPVDTLKIARELIGGPTDAMASSDGATPAAGDPEAWAFARAIIAMGRSLDLPIVAEGIETTSQLEALRGLHCEFGQGYLFGRPASPEALIASLRARPAARRSA